MATTKLQEIKKIIAENPQLINAELQNPSILGKEAGAGNAECVDLLLKSGAEVDIIDIDYNTPIVYCLRSGDDVKKADKLECLRLLINAGSQLYGLHNYTVYRPQLYGLHNYRTPLMVAANLCDEDCLREILKVGYLNGPKKDLLLDSNQNNVKQEMNDEDGVQDEDDFSDSDINNEYDRYKINHSNYHKRYMAKYRTSLDFRDRHSLTAVYHCLFDNETPVPVTTSKKITCLRILKKAGCSFSITHFDGTLIDTAMCLDFDIEIIQLLMEFGCEINFYDCLLWAARNLDLPAVKFFIEKGANLEEMNQSGGTVLHEVLRKYDEDEDNDYAGKQYTTTEEKYERTKTMMKFFVKEKVDLNAKLNNRLPAVVLACSYYLINFNFPLEYLISENVALEHNDFKFGHDDSDALYWGIKICGILGGEIDDWYRANFTGIKKIKLLKFLHLCGMSRNECLHFRDDEEPGSEIMKWLDELSSKPDTLLSICSHKIRKFIGHDIKDKVAGLKLPSIIKDLLLLKDILTSECFE